ncbi:Tripartite-type tricarboxylate transporter, receptor component TctC [Sulfitobacter brevis]|uniref:Tripartite-type tricarboxylate transporter, receptor component TctC n=1 Tax=Sulfitobacter brevis TaxID=74348 RepID=A0A1I2H5Y8_9RHOB|nr:tripartite tricarboxylate transporter substrate-binding protein [Sulfitobacter brevis]SFF24780.1 Tripartite-type tricarboxylate transporter, receptor component TctC [Sulfitobacter brevis]
MKTFLKAASAALLLTAATTTATLADGHAWKPEGPIKMIIAFAAGGSADTSGRLIADEMTTATGWDIIPEQVTGKGGINALLALKDAPADGTTIALVVTESLGYNSAASKEAGVSPADFTGLTTTAGFQMGVVAKADTGWASFDDMITAAKGGKDIRFGVMSPKLADLAYLLGEANGVEFNIISVKGGKAVMNGVTAGDMDVGFMAGVQGKGVAAGDLVNLASGMSTALKQTPDAPKIADLGVAYNADGYYVFVAPAGLPDDARAALSEAIASATGTGKAGGMITKAFGGATNIMGADLDALLQAEYNNAGALMQAAQ